MDSSPLRCPADPKFYTLEISSKPLPTITSFTPQSGRPGSSVIITGEFLTGATSVTFGGVDAPILVNSDTQIIAAVPTGAPTGPISVKTLGGTATSRDNFTVLKQPVITSFTPQSGPPGSSVKVTGANLTGATSVTVGGVSAAGFTVPSDTQIIWGVPTAVVVGPITVTTPGGTATSASNFTVTTCPQMTLSDLASPVALVGESYQDQSIKASGGTGPFSHQISGNLPPGLSDVGAATSDTITLSGTPTAAGNYLFTVAFTDKNGCQVSKSYQMAVNCPLLRVVNAGDHAPVDDRTGFVGVDFGGTELVTGGKGPYKLVGTTGQVPGLTFQFAGGDPTHPGIISLLGIPTQEGTFEISADFEDKYGCTGSARFTITIEKRTVKEVTNTNDSGDGSLPNALSFAGTNPGAVISFNISGTPPFTITPPRPLVIPPGTGIDGTSQANSTMGQPIILDLSKAGPLTLNGDGIKVYGLQIAHSPGSGINIIGSKGTIAYCEVHDNAQGGVEVHGIDDTVSQNSFHDNGCEAIALGESCGPPIPERECDGGAGPNNLQNSPVLEYCTAMGDKTTCHGRQDCARNIPCKVEFYANDVCDSSGHGEGKNYLGSIVVTPDATCEATFDFATPSFLLGQYFTATATDAMGDTSEFSACTKVAMSGTTPPYCHFENPKCTVGEGGGPCGSAARLMGSAPDASGTGTVSITVSRAGDVSTAATVDYQTVDGTATQKKKYTIASGTLSFAAGETSKTFTILLTNEDLVEGKQTFYVVLLNPTGGITLGDPSSIAITINDRDTSPPTTNPIDDPADFVTQHYADFLSRVPDAGGLAFWTNEITSCGADQACLQLKRINVSAAYFLSIEFQQTGYLVERIYKAAYGDANGSSTFGGAHQVAVPVVRYSEFMPDTQRIGQGVVVGQTGWEQALENNKQNFTAKFVQRSRFLSALPTSMTPAQFVDKLFMNAGVTPSVSDRQAAINEFGSATTTADVAARARALRDVSENSILNSQEFNRAFVLMQFFGYLRRNPNDPQDTDYTGYDFWLTKLNQFNGNFVNAEMVKAFITSGEYRQRFGPQ